MRGDGEHSFGHGSNCYWCGRDEAAPDFEQPCDERERRKPSEARMRHYDCTSALQDVRQEMIAAELECEEHGYREIGRRVYGLRLHLSDIMSDLERMHPTDGLGEDK